MYSHVSRKCEYLWGFWKSLLIQKSCDLKLLYHLWFPKPHTHSIFTMSVFQWLLRSSKIIIKLASKIPFLSDESWKWKINLWYATSNFFTHPEDIFRLTLHCSTSGRGGEHIHTTYSWYIICQKCEGDCGLWVLNEIIKKIYAESLKKIVGAVWELPAK